MKKERISNSVVARLPRYYRCVEELYLTNCIRVSSATLSARLGFTASQIRQDFSCFGEFGLQGYGYNVKKLRYEIREILGLNSRNTAILVGCGNLGRALLKNFDFEACGFFCWPPLTATLPWWARRWDRYRSWTDGGCGSLPRQKGPVWQCSPFRRTMPQRWLSSLRDWESKLSGILPAASWMRMHLACWWNRYASPTVC